MSYLKYEVVTRIIGLRSRKGIKINPIDLRKSRNKVGFSKGFWMVFREVIRGMS